MPQPVLCPFCSSSVMADPGQTAQCTACGASFVAQAGGAVPAPAPFVPSPPAVAGDMPCPMCGETIKANARVCRFCKAQLAGPPQPPPSYPYAGAPPQYSYAANPPPKKKSSCLLWIILGSVGAVVLLCAGVIVLFLIGKESGAKAMCQANLEQHMVPQLRTETAGGRTDPELDRLRGDKFWKEIAKRRGQGDNWICFGSALKGEQKGLMGPKKPISEVRDDEPVGCCPREAHKDGIWVVYKNGKIEFVAPGSPAYQRATAELTD